MMTGEESAASGLSPTATKSPEMHGGTDALGIAEGSAGEVETPEDHTSGDSESLHNIIHRLIDERDATAFERDDFKDSLQRLKADFENYKRRVREREQQITEQASAEFAEKLIPVFESLEAAMSSEDASDQTGLDQIAKLFFTTLEAEGLEVLKPEGDMFDPNLHEAIEHIPGTGLPEGKPLVVEVFRTGYKWKSRLLRPALVKVQG